MFLREIFERMSSSSGYYQQQTCFAYVTDVCSTESNVRIHMASPKVLTQEEIFKSENIIKARHDK